MKTEFVIAKTVDLAMTAMMYFILAVVASIVLNFITKAYETYTTPAVGADGSKYQKPIWRLIFEITANIFFIAMTFWVIRNAVERVPFFLEGYGGYTHSRGVSMANTILIMNMSVIVFQTSLMDKIRMLNEQLFAAYQDKFWFPKI